MVSILSNTTALMASRYLNLTGLVLNRTIQRLTSGKRINSASDDAAGLSSSTQFAVAARIAAGEVQQAKTGIPFLQVADSALDEVTSLLMRGIELAAIGGADSEYQAIQTQVNQVLTQTQANGVSVFGQTSSTTISVSGAGSWVATNVPIYAGISANGWNLVACTSGNTPGVYPDPLLATLNAAALTAWVTGFQGLPSYPADASAAMTAANNLQKAYPTNPDVASLWSMADYMVNHPPTAHITDSVNVAATVSAASNTVTVSVPAPATPLYITVGGFPPINLITDASAIPTNLGSVATPAGAATASTTLTNALNAVSSIRGNVSSRQQQLSSISNILGIRAETNTQSSSVIQDADIGEEMVNLTKFNTLRQAGVYALSQASLANRSLLTLFA